MPYVKLLLRGVTRCAVKGGRGRGSRISPQNFHWYISNKFQWFQKSDKQKKKKNGPLLIPFLPFLSILSFPSQFSLLFALHFPFSFFPYLSFPFPPLFPSPFPFSSSSFPSSFQNFPPNFPRVGDCYCLPKTWVHLMK